MLGALTRIALRLWGLAVRLLLGTTLLLGTALLLRTALLLGTATLLLRSAPLALLGAPRLLAGTRG